MRWLLSHRAGLAAIREQIPASARYDWKFMTEALAAEKPWWEPGTSHGYHALTYGYLVGEVAAPDRRPHARRRTSAKSSRSRSASTSGSASGPSSTRAWPT